MRLHDLLGAEVVIVGKKDRKEQSRLKWENLALHMQAALAEQDMKRLLQYGALVALNDAAGHAVQPVLDEAQHLLTRPAYDALQTFAARYFRR